MTTTQIHTQVQIQSTSKSFVLSKEKIIKEDCDLRFPDISDGQAVLLQGIL